MHIELTKHVSLFKQYKELFNNDKLVELILFVELLTFKQRIKLRQVLSNNSIHTIKTLYYDNRTKQWI